MQFDSQRAFPYPVLRPENDDYIDGAFQAVVDFYQSKDMQELALEAHFHLSVPEIMARIEDGEAEFVLVVSCRETFYRQRFSTESGEIKVSLPAGHIRGEVEALPFVVAKKDIKSYTSTLINKEFGAGPFHFEQASVLAMERPNLIYIDRENFKPVTSIFELVQNINVPEYEWQLGFSGDKVQIQLNPVTKEKIDNFRVDQKNKAILLNSIYFSAVMQCLSVLKSADDYNDCRWANIVRQQCEAKGIDLASDDEYKAAQKLLKLPLSLMDTYLFKGAGE